MVKVISPAELEQLKAETIRPEVQAELEKLVAPTADDLMELTLAAFADVDSQLDIAADQREALRAALQKRLIAVLTGQVYPDRAPTTEAGKT